MALWTNSLISYIFHFTFNADDVFYIFLRFETLDYLILENDHNKCKLKLEQLI